MIEFLLEGHIVAWERKMHVKCRGNIWVLT